MVGSNLHMMRLWSVAESQGVCGDQVLADPSNTQNKYCYISPPPSNNIMLQQQHQDHVGIFITIFNQTKQNSIIVENATGR